MKNKYSKELAAEYAEKHLDLKKYYELDENVIGEILDFFNKNN